MIKTHGGKNIKVYLCILTGIIFRVIMSIIHFTHVDDIGVANYLIQSLQITDGNEIDIAKGFASFWTYGPLQIIITQKLINQNMKYLLIIFMGRLPSLICGVLFIGLIYKLLTQINENEILSILLAVCIVSLSWENIIYSAQMEPYSMGLLFSTIVVYFVINQFYRNWQTTMMATTLFSIGCYAQYQLFILVFSMYVVMFLGNLRDRKNLIRIIFAGVVNFVVSIPLLILLWDTEKITRSINWNMGKNGMFYYQSIAGAGIWEQLKYLFNFFSQNIFICFKYLFLADSLVYVVNIVTIILLLCACLGIYYIHRNKEYIMFALFHDLTFAILLVMIIGGRLTLGPSRHILFMVPIWIVLIYFGAIQLTNNAKYSKYYEKMLKISILLIIVLFVLSLPEEIFSRKNLISEEYVRNLIYKYEPDIVYTDPNLNDLFLIDVDGYSNYSNATWTGWLQKVDISVSPQACDSIILMSRNRTLDDFKVMETQRIEEFVNRYNLDTEWSNLNNYSVVYKKEIRTDAEVEYARDYYSNFPNGLFVYVLTYDCNG